MKTELEIQAYLETLKITLSRATKRKDVDECRFYTGQIRTVEWVLEQTEANGK